MRRLLLICLGLAGLPACGGTYIILALKADLQIPVQANSLQIITLDAGDLGRELSNVDLQLDAGDTFPVEVLLEPSDDTPERLYEHVVARLDGVAVAENAVEHAWAGGRTNRVTFTLDLLP
jgi:hypothetical protein